MKPFLVTLGVAVAALVASLYHRNGARDAAVELTRLQAEEATAVAKLAEVQARSDVEAQRLKEVSRELAEAMAELRSISETETDPATEGAWPSDRPYFYLPKRFLPDIAFTALTADGEPTAECIALLGMTPAERAELLQAWTDLRFELQELQLRSAERVPQADTQADPDRRSIRYRLSNLTDQIPLLRDQLGSRLVEALGTNRAGILQARLKEHLASLTPPIGDSDCFVTYRAERTAEGDVEHYLRFDATEGRRTHQAPLGILRANPRMTEDHSRTFPIGPDSPLWNYRHLFGEQPLLRPH